MRLVLSLAAVPVLAVLLQSLGSHILLVNAFTSSSFTSRSTPDHHRYRHQGHNRRINNNNNQLLQGSVSASSPLVTASDNDNKQLSKLARLRQEGGIFSFPTKFGALNPYAIYYGIVAISLGIPWFIALKLYQFFQFITRGKIDKQRKIPVLITHLWGTTLMTLTRQFPKMINRDILTNFYKQKRPAMFVANHSSWQDIPFLGVTIGWRNYKLISKKELYKVPILGTAIKVGGNIMVDRTNRRSQLLTLKTGIQYLKDGVHLCTFPEGTRTKTGKLAKFKNGAFKMAHKAQAPVVPVSIVRADKVQPSHWMFPFRPAAGICQVVLHQPIESKGKTEEELALSVRHAMMEGLDDYQKPTDAT